MSGSGVVVVEVGGELAVGVGLGEELVAFCSTAATASAPAIQRSGGSSRAIELHEGAAELGGVAALLAVHRLPGLDGLPRCGSA